MDNALSASDLELIRKLKLPIDQQRLLKIHWSENALTGKEVMTKTFTETFSEIPFLMFLMAISIPYPVMWWFACYAAAIEWTCYISLVPVGFFLLEKYIIVCKKEHVGETRRHLLLCRGLVYILVKKSLLQRIYSFVLLGSFVLVTFLAGFTVTAVALALTNIYSRVMLLRIRIQMRKNLSEMTEEYEREVYYSGNYESWKERQRFRLSQFD